MKENRISKRSTIRIVAVFIALVLVSCAGSKKFNFGNNDTGFILTYRGDKGEVLKYRATTNMLTIQEMMGQEMEIGMNSIFEYSLKIEGVKSDGALKMSLTFDKFKTTAKGPQGETTLEPEEIIGKTASMVIGIDGKTIERSGFDGLPPISVAGQSIDFKNQFRNLFSELPQKPLKLGDTWQESRTDTVNQSGLDINVESKTTYSLVEEVFQGKVECLKIEGKTTVSMVGEGDQPGGVHLILEGEGEGSSVILFAYKLGKLIRTSSDVVIEGNAMVSGPADMSVPFSQNVKTIMELSK